MTGELYYDPFDLAIDADPYPIWKRMRAQAPLYYNEKYNFYALSRWDDVVRELPNWQTYRSGRGTTADVLFQNNEIPPGILLWEDPPIHDLHRKLLSKVFTPRRMLAVEDWVRASTARALDTFIGEPGFDLIADLGSVMPMQTIGYLLGLPERDQERIRDTMADLIALEPGQQDGRDHTDILMASLGLFAEYIEWRAAHPSDDLMTELLNAEIEEDGARRRLTREEVLAYTAMIAGAGAETSTRLIGFMGQLLAEHPDQRRELVADPSLIPFAVEETLRFESPSPVQARYVARDAVHHGTNVPEGSFMLLLNGSANRDESHYTDPDRFDIHRRAAHLGFGQGIHFCLGSSLARLEVRVAFEEILTRWPDWEVDYSGARMSHTSSVRGWGALPLRTA